MDAIKGRPQFKDHPLWRLERIAGSILDGADDCINGFRVDIERLIQTKYRIIIDTHYHLAEYNVEAFMLTRGRRLFINFNLLDNPRFEQRYRFTLAEELAHFVIHHKIYEDCETIEERIECEQSLTRQERYYLETNAKALGSAILMPKDIIEPRVEKLLSITKKDPKHTGSIINILSNDFDVSRPAATRRLVNLGYHKRSGLKLRTT